MNFYSLDTYLFKSHRTRFSSISISWSSFLRIHCVESTKSYKALNLPEHTWIQPLYTTISSSTLAYSHRCPNYIAMLG